MTAEMWIIAATRITGSLPVLRWPFWGAIFAMVVDLSDLFQMNLIELGGVRDYQRFDKWLDQFYMALFLVVTFRWELWVRIVSVALYAFRMAGFLVFEATGERDLLIAFPNLFEVWFLLIAGAKEFRLDLPEHRQLVIFAGMLLVAVKMLQEYALHVGRWFDGFTAVEAVEAIWDWFTSPFR